MKVEILIQDRLLLLFKSTRQTRNPFEFDVLDYHDIVPGSNSCGGKPPIPLRPSCLRVILLITAGRDTGRCHVDQLDVCRGSRCISLSSIASPARTLGRGTSHARTCIRILPHPAVIRMYNDIV